MCLFSWTRNKTRLERASFTSWFLHLDLPKWSLRTFSTLYQRYFCATARNVKENANAMLSHSMFLIMFIRNCYQSFHLIRRINSHKLSVVVFGFRNFCCKQPKIPKVISHQRRKPFPSQTFFIRSSFSLNLLALDQFRSRINWNL